MRVLLSGKIFHLSAKTTEIFFQTDYFYTKGIFLLQCCEKRFKKFSRAIFLIENFAAAACKPNKKTGDAIFDILLGQQALSFTVFVQRQH